MKLKYKIVLIGVAILISPLVIGNFRFSIFTYPLLWIGFPFFIYSLLPKKRSVILSTLLALAAVSYFLVTSFFLLRLALCTNGQMEYKYVSKRNSSVKIVGRDFSCYGTSNDLILYKEFSISDDIKIQIHYKTFADYRNINIDTTIWQRIK